MEFADYHGGASRFRGHSGVHYGLQFEYDIFYRFGSIVVHASDALNGITPEEQDGVKRVHFSLHSKAEEVTKSLGLGNGWFIKLVAAAARYFAVKLSNVNQLYELEARLDGSSAPITVT